MLLQKVQLTEESAIGSQMSLMFHIWMVFHGNLDSGFQDLSIGLTTTPLSLEGPGALTLFAWPSEAEGAARAPVRVPVH